MGTVDKTAERMKQLRRKAGLTQGELALATGISWPRVQKIEAGGMKARSPTSTYRRRTRTFSLTRAASGRTIRIIQKCAGASH